MHCSKSQNEKRGNFLGNMSWEKIPTEYEKVNYGEKHEAIDLHGFYIRCHNKDGTMLVERDYGCLEAF